MAFQLSDVITAARDRHAAFHRTRVPDATLGRFLTDYQNVLIRKIVGRQAHALDQSVTISIAIGAGVPGSVGAGTSGGLPAIGIGPGQIGVAEQVAGALVDVATTAAGGAVVLVPDRVVTAATTTTVQSTGAGRTVNQDQGKTIEITAGTGIGQRVLVASNTIDTWTLTAPWGTTPDTSSMLRVVAPLLSVQNDLGVVTQLPAYAQTTGYLVSLNAQGQPYINYAAPLVANIDIGVPLPSVQAITGGTVHYIDTDTDPLCFTTFGQRFMPPRFPAVWVAGQVVHLCGSAFDWQDVATLEILYVPIAPAFVALTDYFLLPDAARTAVVAQTAAFAAERVAGMTGITINPAALVARGGQAETDYLSSLSLGRRAQSNLMRYSPYGWDQ